MANCQGMTRKLSITLPDDVAAYLDHVDDASAYIAEAIRRARRSERTRAMLASHGIDITDDGVAAAGERLRTIEKRRQATKPPLAK